MLSQLSPLLAPTFPYTDTFTLQNNGKLLITAVTKLIRPSISQRGRAAGSLRAPAFGPAQACSTVPSCNGSPGPCGGPTPGAPAQARGARTQPGCWNAARHSTSRHPSHAQLVSLLLSGANALPQRRVTTDLRAVPLHLTHLHSY